jgi:hypothetical protein
MNIFLILYNQLIDMIHISIVLYFQENYILYHKLLRMTIISLEFFFK